MRELAGSSANLNIDFFSAKTRAIAKLGRLEILATCTLSAKYRSVESWKGPNVFAVHICFEHERMVEVDHAPLATK
jgi:hypothetical protein